VEVKADKKLLTVLFPDGRDGRAFTLKVLPSSCFLCQIMSHLNYDVVFFHCHIIRNVSIHFIGFLMYNNQNRSPYVDF
jgi:hypothetical protein